MQSTDLGELVIGFIIGIALVFTLPVILLFAAHEPEVIAILLLAFFVLAGLVKGIMVLLHRSDERRRREVQEHHERHYQQLRKRQAAERAARSPEEIWANLRNTHPLIFRD